MSIILDGTNGISDVDGSASTPALRGTDANTGIYFPAADTAAISTGGSERMRIDSSGNVGINTTSPASKLDISTGGSTGTTDMITLSGLDSGSAKQTYGVIRMGIENNTASSEQGNIVLQTVESGTVRDRININGSGYISFINGGTERARITSGGDLQFNSGYGSVATAYGCRAWVNFNGTGTVAIRASGNVTSITDNGGTGDYTVNFTNALPDVNYSVTASLTTYATNNYASGAIMIRADGNSGGAPTTMSTTAVRIVVGYSGNLGGFDTSVICLGIFR